jgi:uncharacterized protein with ParB-like and HNH nuclease domain
MIKTIPVYQRNYSWNEQQCEQLFNDIIETSENNLINSHFTGIVMTIVEKDNEGKETHIIVDGQQRITTTTILLKAFSDEIEKTN